jgi:type IV secretion system protein TrbL
MKRSTIWLFIGMFFIAAPAFAANPGYDLGSIMTQYQTAAAQFGQNITSTALKLCYTLFAIDLAWAIVVQILKGSDSIEIGVTVIMRVMWLSFVIWIINNPSIPLAFVNGFIQIGKAGANTTAISPGDVFWQGIDLVNLMMTKFSDGATVAGIPVPAGIAAMANPFAAFLLSSALIVIIVCFALLAAQFAVAWVQLWFYLAIYPIVLAFGITKWTKDAAMKIFTTPLIYGVRFMAIYFIIAVGTTLASSFGDQIANLSLADLTPIWTVLAGSVMLLMLALKAPTLASDLLNGSASLSAGDAVGAGLAAGAAVATVAGGVAAAGGGIANSVGGAIKAGHAALDQAKVSGSTGIMGTAGAIGSAVGQAAIQGIKGLGGDSVGGRLAKKMSETTAGIREEQAAGAPAASVPGGSSPPVPSAAPPSRLQQSRPPSATSQVANSAKAVLDEVQKTGAAEGGSVQTQLNDQ